MAGPPTSRLKDARLSGSRGGRSPASDRGTSGPGWQIPTPRAPLSEAVGRSRPGRTGRPRGALTERDLDLVRQLADGRSVAQVAVALAVSRNTARTRIRRVSDKLAVTGRYEVVAAARRAGVI